MTETSMDKLDALTLELATKAEAVISKANAEWKQAITDTVLRWVRGSGCHH